ncbi:MAG: serine hydroxymethyltransferase [Anaerolineae bacterium]|nr:serine hydroxymethyltransferase [Anaerolineae bacterium]
MAEGQGGSAPAEDRCRAIAPALAPELCEIWGVSDRELAERAQSGAVEGLARLDPELFAMFVAERKRQQETLELIASENYVCGQVLAVQGSILTNKYAEGYPGRRYYGGCEHVDVAEQLAIERACTLFGSEHANVQPHSGSQANAAAYMALLEGGDTILAMSLAHGGHLTHGHPINFSGEIYHFVHYGVARESEQIDYDEVAALARAHRPRLILAGASAYSRLIDFARLRAIADEVGAYLMVDMAHIAGLVAGGVHPSPVPYAHVVTTTTHKTLRGPRGGLILCGKDLARAIDRAVFPGIQGGPMMHTIAAKAVALRLAMRPTFKAYVRRIVANAQALATDLQTAGLRIVSGGTDNHLMLVDVGSAGLTGADAEAALERAGVATNKNMIPYDPNPPRVTSGIRIGTPAVTTRGMGREEMARIAAWIGQVLHAPADEGLCAAIREEVRALCQQFPIPILEAD